MANLDLKYYWAVFKRRLPYFLVILTLLAAIGITVASILPPVYQSSASLLAEPQQIPGSLAESTAEINPFEQIQIVEQQIMTRANLYDLAQRIGLYADQPDLSVGDIIGDMRDRIEFIGFEPDPTVRPGTPGAIIVGVSFDGPTPAFAAKGANELVSLILQENVRMRTDRASDTLDFFQGEVERLSAALAEQSKKIADFKTANIAALPDSMDSRRAQQEREEQRLLDLQREEAALKNQRATMVWVFERTGRATNVPLSPEEEELQNLQSQLLQQQAIYKEGSPQIRVLQTRIAALQSLVAEQQAARAVPGADGQPTQPLSELEVELAPIDEQLKYIADERAGVEQTLADLAASLQATPENEMTLSRARARVRQPQDPVRQRRRRPRPGPGHREDRGSLQGPALHPDRGADREEHPGQPAAAADRLRRHRRRPRRGGRLHRPLGDAEPLDPPAGRALQRPRHPADRHHPLHADGGRAAAQARAGPRHPRADRDRHPVRAPGHPHAVHAARPAARRCDRLGARAR